MLKYILKKLLLRILEGLQGILRQEIESPVSRLAVIAFQVAVVVAHRQV